MDIDKFRARVVAEALAELKRSPAPQREHVVELPGNAEPVLIRQGGREWVVAYDIAEGEYVCRPGRADR